MDGTSVGDEARFVGRDVLERAIEALPRAPAEAGTVSLLVARTGETNLRERPARARLTVEAGMPGDAWSRRATPLPEAQLGVMQVRVAEAIANGQPLPLFGDNLYLDLDLSATNLPIGSRVRVGQALCEVTAKAHTGCKKFRARFGLEALEVVNAAHLRHLKLRGIFFRVLEPGDVAVGDPVVVVERAASVPE